MNRLTSSIFLLMFLSGSLLYGQGNKPVKTISLDQLLGKKRTSTVIQPVNSVNVSSEHVGAIGSVLERVELQGTSLRQEQINTPYHRYVVKGTMDLGGKTVSIPDGCILDLEQGSLKNGSLKMNTTLVTPIYGISKERNISKVKVSGEYYETLVDLWGELTEPLFPWDTTAPKKVYIVDLKRFGITPGYQKKGSDGHYSDRQYDLMYNNGVGFTNAIRWAYDNGYDGVRFPKNDYCFTPRTTKNDKPAEAPVVLVQDYDKYDIDLGGGSYYLILDSKKKSKYYSLTPDKPYSQGETMFFVAACINLQIHDGFMVGDRSLRDYDDSAEKSQEKSRAFAVSGYCQNIRLHHLEMRDFMADGISCAQSGGIWRGYDDIYQGIWRAAPGKSRPVAGDRNNTTLTDYFKINLYTQKDAMKLGVVRKIASRRAFSVNNNQGYTRLINPYHNLEILTFDEKKSKDIPLRTIKSSYLETIFLSPEETGVKIRSAYDEGATKDGLQHSETISELISSHVVIEYCSFEDNHRGGISGGSNDVTVRYCTFHKNHKTLNYSGRTIPLYLFGGTNYHINFEDNYAKDLKVYGCNFSRTANTIGKLLFGVYTMDFHDNVSDVSVAVYNNVFCNIHKNRFSCAPLWFSSWRHSDYDEGLQKHGFKYLTRVALVHNNEVGNQNSPGKHNRTVAYFFDNR